MIDLDKKLEAIVNKMSITESIDRGFYNRQVPVQKVKEKSVLSYELTPFGDSITLIPMADLHLGHKNCNYNKIQEHLCFINETRDCYTIFLGDEAEAATRTSVGMGMFEEDKHLPEQMESLYQLLKPLADNQKILGMITGNHGMRMANLIGINTTEELARLIHVPYLGYQGFLDIQVGDQNYEVVAFHGTGGGSTSGGKVNAAERMSKVIVADLFITGHTHIRHKSEDSLYQFEQGELVQRTRHYVTCGSFLEYFGGYAEMKALPPVTTGSVCIELLSNRKQIIVHI